MPTLWRAPTREHGSLPGSADFETLRLRAPRVAAVAESLIDLPGSVRKGVQGMRRLFVGDGQPADDFVPTPEEEVGKESESRAAFVARWRVLYSVLAAKAGGIRLADYRELLRLANEGREPTDLELEARFRDADHDGYGVIDFKRFMFGRGNEDTIAIVALTPEAVEQLRAASAAGEQDLRLAEQARQLLAVHDELNASLLPELLRGLISTRIALEPQTTGMLLSSYAAVGSIGESIARVRNARDRLDQLPERVRGGQSVRDSMPTLAAPRSQRHKGRWARLAPYMPPVAEVELAVLFLQFCGLTYSLQITFLKSSTDGAENTLLAASGKVLGWTSIFTLDLESLRSWAESVGANSIAAAASAPSYTTMYVSTCAAIPIVVAFAMLVNFMPLYQVLWMFGTSLSLALIFASIVAVSGAFDVERILIFTAGNVTQGKLDTFLGLSCACFCTFGLICGLWLLYTYVSENAKLKLRVGDFEAGRATVGKKAADELKAQLRGEGEHARSGKPLAKKVQARNIALASILLVLANIDSYSPAAYDFWALGTALSVLLNFCAICAFIYMGLVQSQWGRSRVAEVSFVIELVAVPGLTLLLAIIYIPITRYALTAWYSYGVSCGRGFRFPELTVSLTETLSVSLRGGDIVCEPCVFASFDQEAVSWAHSLNFKTAGACLAQFCSSETTSKRSANDVRYNYGSIILSFLGPVSILTLLAVSIGIPLFNFRLTQQHSRSLSRLTVNKEFAKAVVELQEMTWRYHLFATRNRATSLYAPFRRAWRQTWLLVMAQRLIATVVTASFVGVRVADTVVMPAVHGLFLLFWLGARPFFDAKTSAFAVALAVASLFNALAIPIAVAQAGTDLTGDWTGLVISVNFCLPVLALLAFAYPSHRARRHMLRETDKFEEGLTLEEAEKEDALFLQLDKDLDAQTTRLASVSIFGLALVGFLTIGVTILVGLKQLEVSAVLPATSPIFGSRLSANNPSCEVERLVKKHEFAGFQSWPEFTANCCCAERETAAAYGTAAIVGRIELWTCANSEFANKERDREGDDLKARGFCSPAFTSGYSLPAYSSSLLQMAITRPDGKLIASGSGW